MCSRLSSALLQSVHVLESVRLILFVIFRMYLLSGRSWVR